MLRRFMLAVAVVATALVSSAAAQTPADDCPSPFPCAAVTPLSGNLDIASMLKGLDLSTLPQLLESLMPQGREGGPGTAMLNQLLSGARLGASEPSPVETHLEDQGPVVAFGRGSTTLEELRALVRAFEQGAPRPTPPPPIELPPSMAAFLDKHKSKQ